MIRTAAAALFFAALAPLAQASTVPYGVQTNVSSSTVAGWGFTQCYVGSYASTASISTVLAGCQGDVLMLAGRATGSSTFSVLAAADRADVLFDVGTGSSADHNANGVSWYYSPSYSWGFAGLNDAVSRNSCDTGSSNAAQRLCWHTSGGSIVGGWRVGAATGLNGSTAYERVILVGTRLATSNDVPEPGSLLLAGVALAGLGLASRRRRG